MGTAAGPAAAFQRIADPCCTAKRPLTAPTGAPAETGAESPDSPSSMRAKSPLPVLLLLLVRPAG